MFTKLNQSVSKICIHTGNVLNINELKKKPGQNQTEELLESLRIVLKDWVPPTSSNGAKIDIYGENEENRVTGPEEQDELKISVKVFVTTGKTAALSEAIENVIGSLGTEKVDSLVVSYYNDSENEKSGEQLDTLRELWKILETAVQNERILRIGVSDVDAETFISLYQSSKIKPSIVQINLSTCCVVPPQLQEFTKQNDVQLLTHNDPQDLLPESALQNVFKPLLMDDEVNFKMYWAARFLVHVKCRGVLASKGYVVCTKRATTG